MGGFSRHGPGSIQVAREIVSNTDDKTEVSLIFANVTEDGKGPPGCSARSRPSGEGEQVGRRSLLQM